MAQELKELCHLLFPNSERDNVAYFGEVSDYIKQLGSKNWDYISKEPDRLNEEMKILTKETQDLAFTNYKSFVETAEISKTIMVDLKHSKESLTLFDESVPNFVQECEKFSQMAADIVKEKNNYSTIRNQSEKLLELLELPSLMREALNADDYESALDIFAFVRNLSRRYSEIPIVQNTTSEIMTLWFETLYQLFNQLRYDLPLPQCLQILGYLRRANTVYKSTEDEHSRLYITGTNNTSDGLHLHFLKARNAWFDKSLEEAQCTESSERMLRKQLELHRIHLFNVLTQHKSIFITDTQETKVKDDELNGTSALSSWLKRKMESLAQTLNQNLLKEDEANFESLFNQSMYLCLSFGRIGADMRCVLTPLFRNILLIKFHHHVVKANNQFEFHMKAYKVSSIRNVPRPTSANAQIGPPETLLDYYPLAEYCNGLLTALNSLRATAPLNIVKKVYNSFENSMAKAVSALTLYYQREQPAFTDTERENFTAFCVCFTDEFVPYIIKCLSQIFPSAQVAEYLGVTQTALQDSEILQIDQLGICDPLTDITGVIVN